MPQGGCCSTALGLRHEGRGWAALPWRACALPRDEEEEEEEGGEEAEADAEEALPPPGGWAARPLCCPPPGEGCESRGGKGASLPWSSGGFTWRGPMQFSWSAAQEAAEGADACPWP